MSSKQDFQNDEKKTIRWKIEEGEGWTKFFAPDGSIVTIVDEEWGLGFDCCHGWQSVGHSSDCVNSQHQN